jgi:multidrug efflux pump subunit AcrB
MKRAIAWFAANGVAANLILFLLVAGGLITLPSIKREIFPEISADVVTVSVTYPGAAPAEIEEGICIRIEEQLYGLEGIKQLRSTASEGTCVVSAEIERGADARHVLDDVKTRVDAIDTFPAEAEKPVIQEVVVRQQVINVAVAGDADERTLKYLAEQVRDEISALPGITLVEIANARPYEISIEVSEEALRRHGLTFDQVAAAVRRTSLDVPGGSIKSRGGEILLRTKGQAYRGGEFEKLVLLTRPDGTRLTLGEVARVVDGFEDVDRFATFDGKPSVLVQVFRIGNQSALEIADAVSRYVRESQPRMPEGITLTTWEDASVILRSRLSTLLRNGRDGFLLVLFVLALFLRLRLALWVILGIPLSFLGALWLMPSFDLSINLISLFAFIVVLGILVDDAIVVGENIHTHQSRGGDRLDGAIRGAQEVALPVVFGVLTTVAAFVPMLMVPGPMGKFMRVVPIIVISALLFSLIESMFVLPSHLAHGKSDDDDEPSNALGRGWRAVRSTVSRSLERFIERVYRPSIELALEWRYVVIAAALSVMLLTGSLIAGRWISFNFFPEVEGDYVLAYLTLPQGTPADVTRERVELLAENARQVIAEIEAEGRGRVTRHVMASVGAQPHRAYQNRSAGLGEKSGGSHLGEVNMELVPSEQRSVRSVEIEKRWRERTGQIADAVELVFSSSLISSGEPINVQLKGPSIDHLREAAERLKERLGEYSGVYDVADSFRGGKKEIKLDILPAAETLGLTLSDLGRQVRQAFYGEEAQRIQRGRDDVKVMVRYPAEQRRSLGDIENMRIRTPDGAEVPFAAVARVEIGRGFSAIRRADRQRIINVTASVDTALGNANEIASDLRQTILPALAADTRGLSYAFEGEQREQSETLGGLGKGFLLALLAIYAILAVPLRSYVQPLIIMGAIPFGLVGAVWGHVITGYDLSMFSVVGLVALSGVVVNDSLVLVDYVNRARERGEALRVAIRRAGVARFRAILLTSLTTFAGLTPLMLEKSVQAQLMVPMAISLAFGVLFSTFISLMLVPASYMVLEDLLALPARLRRRGQSPTGNAPAPHPDETREADHPRAIGA